MVGDTIEGTHAGVRHTRRRYAATLAALIAASAVVAGCTTSTAGPGVTTTATSGSSTATTTPTATATSTPSATTAPTAAYPADVPAEARANTPDGAKAFARHFFGQVNKAYTTPQTGLLAPLSTPNCKTCAAAEDNASSYLATGRRYDRDALDVLEVALDAETISDGHVVDVTAHQRPAKVVDSAGTVTEQINEVRSVFVVWVRRVAGSWRIDSVKVLG